MKPLTMDEVLAATRGTVLVVKGALADQDVLGSASYSVGELDCRWYREVGEAHVLAVRQHFGTALPGRPSPGRMPCFRRSKRFAPRSAAASRWSRTS